MHWERRNWHQIRSRELALNTSRTKKRLRGMEWIRVHANEDVLPPRRWALLFKLKMWGVVWLFRPKERHPSHLGGPWANRWSSEGGEGLGPGGRTWAWTQPRLSAGIKAGEKWGSRAEPRPTSDTHMGTDKWNFRGPTGAAELRPGGGLEDKTWVLWHQRNILGRTGFPVTSKGIFLNAVFQITEPLAIMYP